MLDNENRIDIREELLRDYDVRDGSVAFASERVITTADLWWLYDQHRIMAPADAWLLTAMWEGQICEESTEKTIANPRWWEWFDQGLVDARHNHL